MTKQNIEITPTTKVNELLNAFPDLEETLIGIAPPFKKLRNPFLRRSVAKVATLKHISSVGNIPLDELINKLREAVGQPPIQASYGDEEYYGEKPSWFSSDKIVVSVDEAKLEDKDKMTLVAILERTKEVGKGEIIELVTTFLPAPGIDAMKSKGYSVWTLKEEDGTVRSYFLKNDG
jgi:hypothetical protein